jgi:hypothetical protein
MQNSQVNEFSPATSMLQVASYFDLIDNAVKTGDTNKRYSMSTNSSTAPSPPVLNGSFTSLIISPTADNMCDLYNSFIDVKLTVGVKNSRLIAANTTVPLGTPNRAVWIGYKDSLDAIESYSIVVNGQSIYTQNY